MRQLNLYLITYINSRIQLMYIQMPIYCSANEDFLQNFKKYIHQISGLYIYLSLI